MKYEIPKQTIYISMFELSKFRQLNKIIYEYARIVLKFELLRLFYSGFDIALFEVAISI